MNEKHLLETARKLKQVDQSVAEEYINKADELTNKMNTAMLGRPDLDSLVTENNIAMMKDNHANHVRFIGSVLKSYSPEVLVDTVLWVFRAYRSHGFKTNYWAAQLGTWHEIIKDVLSPDTFKEVYPFYEWMQINIPIFVKVSDQNLESSNSMH